MIVRGLLEQSIITKYQATKQPGQSAIRLSIGFQFGDVIRK